MPKFDAGKAIEPLEYDFTAFGGSKGVVPEPTTKRVDDFMNAARTMMSEFQGLGLTGQTSDADMAEKISELPDNLLSNANERMIDMLADFCADSPPRVEIEQLPYRVLAAFMAWLMAAIRPESTPAVTTR